MKEIIYVQAGNISNHIGTHFWNTQESYFTYDEDADTVVNHDISFREGRSLQGEQTFCPRLLLFDYRGNFGALARYNELYQDPQADESGAGEGLWNGHISEHRQEPVQKSQYQQRLENEQEGTADEDLELLKIEPRYWSDYNRIYYVPRSIQQVSDLPDWEANNGDWGYGKRLFQSYDSEFSVMDESLRSFVEECDMFQGFQMMFDNATFGAFTVAFIEAVSDEFPKAPVLTFPVMGGSDDTVLRDATCIRALNELSTVCMPLRVPSSLDKGQWSEHLDLNFESLYQTSAVLSAHVESATLPLRLKGGQEDLSDVGAQLNWTQNTKFSNLGGIFPLTTNDILKQYHHDFSTHPLTHPVGSILAQRNTTRGLAVKEAQAAEAYFATADLGEPYLSSVHAPAYPLPSSYPRFFRSTNTSTLKQKSRPGLLTPSSSTKMISSLTTTTATSHLFKAHAEFVDECVRTRRDVGVSPDELKELATELWNVHDGYAGVEFRGDDELGEDE